MSTTNKKSKHGGPRPGAGRKRGTKNPATIQKEALLEEVIERAVDGETTPLEVMLQIMRAPETPALMRFEAAKAAAPYVHPRLSQVDSTVTHKRDADEFDRAELIAIASRAGTAAEDGRGGPLN
jgi:hypothetical protein